MSESHIDVEVLEKRTIVTISRSRNVTNISLETFVDAFHVLTNKIENIKKESISKKSIFEKLRYSQSDTIVSRSK